LTYSNTILIERRSWLEESKSVDGMMHSKSMPKSLNRLGKEEP
jgi:hypothetical protein